MCYYFNFHKPLELTLDARQICIGIQTDGPQFSAFEELAKRDLDAVFHKDVPDYDEYFLLFKAFYFTYEKKSASTESTAGGEDKNSNSEDMEPQIASAPWWATGLKA
jgi:hypothetical protein